MCLCEHQRSLTVEVLFEIKVCIGDFPGRAENTQGTKSHFYQSTAVTLGKSPMAGTWLGVTGTEDAGPSGGLTMEGLCMLQ